MKENTELKLDLGFLRTSREEDESIYGNPRPEFKNEGYRKSKKADMVRRVLSGLANTASAETSEIIGHVLEGHLHTEDGPNTGARWDISKEIKNFVTGPEKPEAGQWNKHNENPDYENFRTKFSEYLRRTFNYARNTMKNPDDVVFIGSPEEIDTKRNLWGGLTGSVTVRKNRNRQETNERTTPPQTRKSYSISIPGSLLPQSSTDPLLASLLAKNRNGLILNLEKKKDPPRTPQERRARYQVFSFQPDA